jgi:hypothetical protein
MHGAFVVGGTGSYVCDILHEVEKTVVFRYSILHHCLDYRTIVNVLSHCHYAAPHSKVYFIIRHLSKDQPEQQNSTVIDPRAVHNNSM